MLGDAARSREQREALDHVWDAALCGSLPRLRDALQREGAARAASSSGALVRPPWAFVSARDRTPRLGRTALASCKFGGAAVAAAQRRLRRDCAAATPKFRKKPAVQAVRGRRRPGPCKVRAVFVAKSGRGRRRRGRLSKNAPDVRGGGRCGRVVAVLLEHGADVRVCDEAGLTLCTSRRRGVARRWPTSCAPGASGGAKDHCGRTARTPGLAARRACRPATCPRPKIGGCARARAASRREEDASPRGGPAAPTREMGV